MKLTTFGDVAQSRAVLLQVPVNGVFLIVALQPPQVVQERQVFFGILKWMHH